MKLFGYLSSVLYFIFACMTAYGFQSPTRIEVNQRVFNGKIDLNELTKSKRPLSEVKQVTLVTKTPFGLGQVQLQSGNVFSASKRVDGTQESYLKESADTYHKVVIENPNLRKSSSLFLHLHGEHQLKQVIIEWDNIPR